MKQHQPETLKTRARESNNNISETSLELSKHGTVVYASIITLIDWHFMKTSIEWLLLHL